MEQKYINGQQLHDFVETHSLSNRYSVIHFNAIVSITTTQNKITNKRLEVMITFGNYDSLGRVTLMESELDPNLFPTVFEADWQKMEHIDHEYLLITDTHKQKPVIGKYSVKIIPLEKLRD